VQGEGMRTREELRLVSHRSSEDNLEEGGGEKMGMRDAVVTDAQACHFGLTGGLLGG